jgi:hypothetical protein
MSLRRRGRDEKGELRGSAKAAAATSKSSRHVVAAPVVAPSPPPPAAEKEVMCPACMCLWPPSEMVIPHPDKEGLSALQIVSCVVFFSVLTLRVGLQL